MHDRHYIVYTQLTLYRWGKKGDAAETIISAHTTRSIVTTTAVRTNVSHLFSPPVCELKSPLFNVWRHLTLTAASKFFTVSVTLAMLMYGIPFLLLIRTIVLFYWSNGTRQTIRLKNYTICTQMCPRTQCVKPPAGIHTCEVQIRVTLTLAC